MITRSQKLPYTSFGGYLCTFRLDKSPFHKVIAWFVCSIINVLVTNYSSHHCQVHMVVQGTHYCGVEGHLHLSLFTTSVNDTGIMFHFEMIPLLLLSFLANSMSGILFIHL